jgi:hypothetical protein
MDDYGTTSDSVNITINVQNLLPLQTSVDLSSSKIHEGEQVSVTVYVTNGTAAVENTTVTMLSLKGGNFTESSGLTNATGYFVTTFNAPDLTKMTNIRIVARASKTGYSDGSDYEYLEVSPFLSVEIIANPDVIKSEGMAQVSIYVKSNEEFVANASVTIHSTDGNLSSETGITDLNGMLSLTYAAPQTTTFLNVTITATATKNDYMNGEGQTTITIEPKILTVRIIAEPTATISEAKLNVTVHVEYEMVPILEANVTVTAESGNFSVTSELTNVYGDVTFIFTAPPVTVQSNITITAQATREGYAATQSDLEVSVTPKTFIIRINAPTVESEGSAGIIVNVTCVEDASSVAGANVSISSGYGNFTFTTETTSATGVCTFIFNAPYVIDQSNVTITVSVTKNGYANGGNQTVITVIPKAAAQAEGWPITTILLIIIPIVIAIVVVILVKLKVIAFSSGEEE